MGCPSGSKVTISRASFQVNFVRKKVEGGICPSHSAQANLSLLLHFQGFNIDIDVDVENRYKDVEKKVNLF